MQLAEWDSNFFKKRIFVINIDVENHAPKLASLLDDLRDQKADGAYIFLSQPSMSWSKIFEDGKISMVDEKLIFEKRLSTVSKSAANYSAIERFSEGIKEDLIGLSIEAGKYSRFKTDGELAYKFEELYKIWIEKSVDGLLADRVYVYRDSGLVKGMITCKLTDKVGTIGLIAVSPYIQGKGIGKALIETAEEYFISNEASVTRVATQKNNFPACRFYTNAGYEIVSDQPVYHVWFKN